MIEVFYNRDFYTAALLYKKNNLYRWSDMYNPESTDPEAFWDTRIEMDLSIKLFEIME